MVKHAWKATAHSQAAQALSSILRRILLFSSVQAGLARGRFPHFWRARVRRIQHNWRLFWELNFWRHRLLCIRFKSRYSLRGRDISGLVRFKLQWRFGAITCLIIHAWVGLGLVCPAPISDSWALHLTHFAIFFTVLLHSEELLIAWLWLVVITLLHPLRQACTLGLSVWGACWDHADHVSAIVLA